MGETGCGKTRLIRYMCDLQAFGSGHQTMLIMKVTYNHLVVTFYYYSTVRFMEVLLSEILSVKLKRLRN